MANSPKLAIAADRAILAPNLAACAPGDDLPNASLDYTDKLFNHTEKDPESTGFCAHGENSCRLFFVARKER
jgi:hypothetical protein